MSKAHFTEQGHPIWGIATHEEHIAYEKAKQLGTCIYFTGILNQQCAAGVPYWPIGQQPCLVEYDNGTHVCALRHLPTEAEAQARAEVRIQEIQASLDRMRHRVANQECLHCGQQWETRKQIGPCIYAYPCGHRQGQGRLPKGERV